MHRAGNVQRHVGEELQQAGQLVGNAFHGVEMTRIDEHYMVAALLGGVGYVELLVAGGEAFNTDAEYLLFNRIDNMWGFEGIDFVEGVLQACTQAISVSGIVLQAVRDPEVVQDHVVHFLAYALCDLAAGDAVTDPEITHVLFGAGNGKAFLYQRVAEQGGVEVDAEAVLLCPGYPGLEVLVLELVAINPGVFLGEDGVARVQVDALLAGDQACCLLEVGHELFGGGGAARVVARGHDATGSCVIVALIEADNIVALPAVHGDGLVCQGFDHCLGVDTLLGIRFARQFVHSGHECSLSVPKRLVAVIRIASRRMTLR